MSRTQIAAGGWSTASVESFPSRRERYHLPPYSEGDGSATDDLQIDHLFEISPDLLAMASFEPFRWLRVNPAFSTVLGWTENELIGRPLLDIVHPADHDRLRASESKLQGGVSLETRLLCKGGGCRWIAWHIAPDERAQAQLLIGRDVTQRRRAMKNLRVASVRMQRENESLEHFVKTAGHDLQEPLRTLSMYSELLMRSYGSKLPDDSRELLLHIFGAASRMHSLVRDLLVYASISQQREQHSKKSKEVSLEVIFKDVLESLESSIADSSATITHDPLPEVYGDDTQLSQLVQNLLSNSLKYRRQDVPLEIHVAVHRHCGEWQFEITDNGDGFDPQQAENIFLDFKRLHGQEIPGTGLGLPICRRIVQGHGGRIWAEGRPGQGATLCFTLPTRPPAPE